MPLTKHEMMIVVLGYMIYLKNFSSSPLMGGVYHEPLSVHKAVQVTLIIGLMLGIGGYKKRLSGEI